MIFKYKYCVLVVLLVMSGNIFSDEKADKERQNLDKAGQKENMPNNVYISVQNDIDKRESVREKAAKAVEE